MSTDELRTFLTKKLAVETPDVDRYNRLYDAKAPLSYLDPKLAREFRDQLTPVNINLGRLAVAAPCQRLQVTGFRSAVGTPDVVDGEITALWRALGMESMSALAHVEALVSGRAFFMVWQQDGQPVVTVESPRQVTVLRDPVTRQIVAALKRFRSNDGFTRSVVMTAERIDTYIGGSAAPLVPDLPMPTVMGEDMVLESSVPNVLGIVPIVALVNRPRVTAPDGQSELTDLEGPLLAVAKLASDLMLASEANAIPRRWISYSGELTSEQAGRLSDSASNTLIRGGGLRAAVLSGGAELHELTVSELTNFDTAIRLFVSQIAALASLPPYYVSGDVANPTSADAIRASESRLTAVVLERQRWWGPEYATLMRLAVVARDGIADPALDDLATMWVDPAPASVAQTADAQSKLLASGITDRRAALESLGLPPLEVERILAAPPFIAL